MDAFQINGGKPLRGTVRINGSKNAALPLMAACLLTTEPVTLHGVPNLSDIRAMQELLASLGLQFASASTRQEAGPERSEGPDRGAPTPTPQPALATPGKPTDPRYAGLTELIKKPVAVPNPATAPQAGPEDPGTLGACVLLARP